ncbi:thioesterase family protein [Actinoallomurus sp. NPDC052274]|uniref:acyl-CoA thioesterase n=1 Tax=Actinoallomurus sp. NPDC052274 TaxID=3155420 RepID=UPI0034305C52
MTQPALDPGHVRVPHRHVHEFHVRFGDIDSLGHVNNCRYLTYLEDARVAMFYTDPEREGRRRPLHGLVVARHEIDYKRPLLLRPEPVRVETRVTEIRAASFRLAYEVRDDEHVYARAVSVMVGYDLKQSRTRRFDTEERAFLERYLVTGRGTGDSSVTNFE